MYVLQPPRSTRALHVSSITKSVFEVHACPSTVMGRRLVARRRDYAMRATQLASGCRWFASLVNWPPMYPDKPWRCRTCSHKNSSTSCADHPKPQECAQWIQKMTATAPLGSNSVESIGAQTQRQGAKVMQPRSSKVSRRHANKRPSSEIDRGCGRVMSRILLLMKARLAMEWPLVSNHRHLLFQCSSHTIRQCPILWCDKELPHRMAMQLRSRCQQHLLRKSLIGFEITCDLS